MSLGKKLLNSVWLFPVLLAIPFVIFTVFSIHGSSVGTYHKIMSGEAPDKNVILNEPRSIRSDEWLVNTQKTISQYENDFKVVNDRLGTGENVSIIVDVPYKEWSIIFKPQNLAFFILPFENAFAFKWWLMGYLLMVSCYFFVLALAPRKRLLSASLAIALFFSAFVQWWYVYGTLASLYYSLFIATTVIYLWRQKTFKKKIALGVLLTYLVSCFALVLYPPFQLACGLVLAAFLIGYALQQYPSWDKQALKQNIGIVLTSGLVAGAIVGVFVFTRLDIIKTASNTAYPGKRSVQSGGFYPLHFLSPQLGYQFNSEAHTTRYLIDGKSPSNQSETSNFLLLLPFLFAPSVYLLYRGYRHNKKIDWPLLLLSGLFLIFLLELFVPGFTPLSKLLLLDKVGGARSLIGLGLINLMVFVLFMRNLSRTQYSFPHKAVIIYSLLIVGIEFALNYHAHESFEPFISLRGAILFSLPLPVIVYLMLRKHFVTAAIVYAAFSIFISFGINPLYRGLTVITDDALSKAVEEMGASSEKRWISEGGYLENIATINGEPSLSGVYNYPQLKLWEDIPGVPRDSYNRYAHVGFQITDDPAAPTALSLITPDSFVVKTNSCSDYLRKHNVGFIVTASILNGPCTSLEKTVSYPRTTLYIYRLR